MLVNRFSRFFDYSDSGNVLSFRYQYLNDKATRQGLIFHPSLKQCPCCGHDVKIELTSKLTSPAVRIKCECGVSLLKVGGGSVGNPASNSFVDTVQEACFRWNERFNESEQARPPLQGKLPR